jgi:hypothetical protein
VEKASHLTPDPSPLDLPFQGKANYGEGRFRRLKALLYTAISELGNVSTSSQAVQAKLRRRNTLREIIEDSIRADRLPSIGYSP